MVPLKDYKKQIIVVGYHEVGGPHEYRGGPKYDIHGLNISPQKFRSQLALMEKSGFYPICMGDLVNKDAMIPKGKKPIGLTFDDGRRTQFRYRRNGQLDPNCVVAILLQFHEKHPDWPLRGDFYLIAGSDRNGVPFDQEGTEKKKVKKLINWGFEIGNHTLTHPSFRNLTAERIEKEVAGCEAYLHKIAPSIHVDTLALPYGEVPRRAGNAILRHGGSGIGRYDNRTVVLFDGGIVPGPGSGKFKPFEISRLAPAPGIVEAYIRRLK